MKKENKSTTRAFMLGYQSALSELESKLPNKSSVKQCPYVLDAKCGMMNEGHNYLLDQIKDIINKMK